MAKAEIPLIGYVWGGYSEMVASYLFSQKRQGKLDSVELTIMSDGGSAYDGINAYEAIKSVGANDVSAFVIGKAHSAASLYLMAADKNKRYATPNSSFILHDPAASWTDGRGTAADHIRTAEILQQIEDTYVAIYTAETSMSEAEVRALLKEDAPITAERALELGIISEIRAVPEKPLTAYSAFTACANSQPQNFSDMSIKTTIAAVAARLGLPQLDPNPATMPDAKTTEQLIAEAVAAKEAETNAAIAELETQISAKMQALETQITTANAALAAEQAKNAELQSKYDRIASAQVRQTEIAGSQPAQVAANLTTAPVAGIDAQANAIPERIKNDPQLLKLYNQFL